MTNEDAKVRETAASLSNYDVVVAKGEKAMVNDEKMIYAALKQTGSTWWNKAVFRCGSLLYVALEFLVSYTYLCILSN